MLCVGVGLCAQSSSHGQDLIYFVLEDHLLRLTD